MSGSHFPNEVEVRMVILAVATIYVSKIGRASQYQSLQFAEILADRCSGGPSVALWFGGGIW